MKVEVLALRRDVLGEKVDKRKKLVSTSCEAGSLILKTIIRNSKPLDLQVWKDSDASHHRSLSQKPTRTLLKQEDIWPRSACRMLAGSLSLLGRITIHFNHASRVYYVPPHRDSLNWEHVKCPLVIVYLPLGSEVELSQPSNGLNMECGS